MVIILETHCGCSQKIEAHAGVKLPTFIRIDYKGGTRLFRKFESVAREVLQSGLQNLYRECEPQRLLKEGPQEGVWTFQKGESDFTHIVRDQKTAA